MKKFLLWLGVIFYSCVNGFSQTFTSSNLPIVVLNTGGKNIDSKDDVLIWMGIIDNGPGNRNNTTDAYNAYNSNITINIHGSSTVNLPKKSYKFSTLDAQNIDIDFPLLGMPAENDWILEAIYQDKSFIRNELTYFLHRKMGHYSPRYKYVEVVIDGDYKGIYGIVEKIKRNKNRVDISKLTPDKLSGDYLTGGYLFFLDHYLLPLDTGWYSNFNSSMTHDSANYFLYKYPKPGSMPIEQKNYIKNWMHKFENVLANTWYTNTDSGYYKYIDMTSFVDNFIMTELARNTDGYRLSSYFYKDRDSKGGKLFCGPLWDFNIAWGNCEPSYGANPAGWQYQQFFYENFIPFWWWQLLSDPAFKRALKCRYQDLRTAILSENKIYEHIDSIALVLDESQQRNFQRWPILGTVIPPAPSPAPATYADEVTVLKNWVNQRIAWLDANMPGNCTISVEENGIVQNNITSMPNPFTEKFSVLYNLNDNAKVNIELYNMVGERLMTVNSGDKVAGTYLEEINTTEITAGIYLLKINMGKSVFTQKIVKAEN
jgi:hypothetical protein